MSEEARKKFLDAQHNQMQSNEARHIRTRVNEARKALHVSGPRWPFELLQNSLDAGPRKGRTSVTVTITEESRCLVFEHDGAPFSIEDLAALLSGGSNKEFESEITTGRFGTGFLSTHVLAEQTEIHGILTTGEGYERFRLTLDRSGDEEEILRNIQLCNDEIGGAQPISHIDELPSARFEYVIDDKSLIALGRQSLRSSLPYLFGTRCQLGQVVFQTETGDSESWTAGDPQLEQFESVVVTERSVTVQSNDSKAEYRILRFESEPEASSAAMLLLELRDDEWEVVIPSSSAPRMYRQYPLQNSAFIPIALVLDGYFEPDQERTRVLMNDQDKKRIVEALHAAAFAVRYACSNSIKNAHLLAKVSSPTSGFISSDANELLWWSEALKSVALEIALLPIVECQGGFLPAVSEDGPFADFVIPRLDNKSVIDETSIERVWSLANEVENLRPPSERYARDWSLIADGWGTLGLSINRISIKSLIEEARGRSQNCDELLIRTDRFAWLAALLDVIGECWTTRSGMDIGILEKFLPNQLNEMVSPGQLKMDRGVSETLKDICDEALIDIRRVLVSQDLAERCCESSLRFASYALTSAVSTSIGDVEVCDENP